MDAENGQNADSLLDVRSLRKQVYEYLRAEMQEGRLLPGAFIRLSEISEKLGVSKTPLRDAIIQMECEGFVTILPRRGVLVNKLSIQDIKNVLEILGALESAVIVSVFDKFDASHISEMQRLNDDMIAAIHREDYEPYYKLNILFHEVFLDVSENTALRKVLLPLKQRLYDFPRRTYIQEWEFINCQEHRQFIEYIRQGQRDRAAMLMRDSHWSFAAYEKFIRRFYFGSEARIESELAWRK
ncbi:MAG: GntR family transcriptional regulator [Desulfosarcina sp.]|nr:GntR family transcriptional regulator [Desulfobacterales bacterium]